MIDWTDAFENSAYVEGAHDLLNTWKSQASAYRDDLGASDRASLDNAYGAADRNLLDLFLPDQKPKGLVVFIHGGYWHRLDKSFWSHFAAASTDEGWAFAIPSYTLAPHARISQITEEVAKAIEFAATMVAGPIRLVGHSAGGHLVSRMMCDPSALNRVASERIEKTVSVSGLHDLRPIRFSDMNEILQMSEDEAASESPALHKPRKDVPVTFWVGAGERPELIRQTRLIAETWQLQGADVSDIYEPGKNHFSVIEALAEPGSALMKELLA